MTITQLVAGDDSCWRLEGDVTLASVPQLLRSSASLFESASTAAVIDLASMRRFDSSSVALMLAWIREAKNRSIKLWFRNVPDKVMAVAGMCGVAEILSQAQQT